MLYFLAVSGCWLIFHGFMNMHNAFCYFTGFEVYYDLVLIHDDCVKMHHHCLLCNKNGIFCITTIILCTMIICYSNVFASSFFSVSPPVYGMSTYVAEPSECASWSNAQTPVVAAHAPRMFEHVLRCLLSLHCRLLDPNHLFL